MKFSAILLLAVLDIALSAPLAVKERTVGAISDEWKREEGVVSFQGEYNDEKKREEGVPSTSQAARVYSTWAQLWISSGIVKVK
ncbi:hypothetical protein B7463_g4769, partial [Scytalidium lignicola]